MALSYEMLLILIDKVERETGVEIKLVYSPTNKVHGWGSAEAVYLKINGVNYYAALFWHENSSKAEKTNQILAALRFAVKACSTDVSVVISWP